MPQTRQNGAVVPINSDEYNLTADLATMADAQGRASLSWTAPGAYLQTAQAETGWLNVAADADPLIRAWVEIMDGTTSNTVSTLASYTSFYADLRPQDD
jgi:hypothetical protein